MAWVDLFTCTIVFILKTIQESHSVPPAYCTANINTSNCGIEPTPVVHYYKPTSMCEIVLWRGCPTLNKFKNVYECSNMCIGKIWREEKKLYYGPNKIKIEAKTNGPPLPESAHGTDTYTDESEPSDSDKEVISEDEHEDGNETEVHDGTDSEDANNTDGTDSEDANNTDGIDSEDANNTDTADGNETDSDALNDTTAEGEGPGETDPAAETTAPEPATEPATEPGPVEPDPAGEAE